MDKAGAPYVLHPLRMMLSLDTPDERMAAVLHDVVEDTSVTLEQLRAEGFPASVIDAVEALTKREGEAYEEFVRRVAPNHLARRVKLATCGTTATCRGSRNRQEGLRAESRNTGGQSSTSRVSANGSGR